VAAPESKDIKQGWGNEVYPKAKRSRDNGDSKFETTPRRTVIGGGGGGGFDDVADMEEIPDIMFETRES
jgi:hypothetical protein